MTSTIEVAEPYITIPPNYDILTTSSRALFQSCPRKFMYRHVYEIVPLTAGSRAQNFGTVIHDALQTWYDAFGSEGGCEVAEALAAIERQIGYAYPDRSDDMIQKENHHYAIAMMRAYARRYPTEEFRVLATEQPAWGHIINPNTGRKMRRIAYALKADGIVQRDDGTYWVLEHKTASTIDGKYLEKLWDDNQIITYVMYLEQYFGIKMQGVLYNVLAKPLLSQHVGETEEQYAVRYAELCSTSKSGKSSAKRKMPESDDEFQGRLAAWFDKPQSFHREEILVYDKQTTEIREELFNTVQQLRWCHRTGIWSRNRNNCYAYQHKCGYFNICAAMPEDEAWAIQNYAVHKDEHTELGNFIPERLKTLSLTHNYLG